MRKVEKGVRCGAVYQSIQSIGIKYGTYDILRETV
jgi:hypothetical protein